MASGNDGEHRSRVPPDEAFAILGEETRLEILRVLGDAGEPLAFSEILGRVDYDDSSNFGYHLERLVGQFVRKSDDGYVLHQAGRRVIEAILSGVITADPAIERTVVDRPCYLCGEAMDLAYRDERVELYCPDCGGLRSGGSGTTDWAADPTADILGFLDLPPAGVRDRTPESVHRAAEVWTVAETQALARDVCPRCSARVERSIQVCEDHEPEDGRCENCDQQFGVTLTVTCSNCILEQSSIATKHLLAHDAMMGFMIDNGIDPIAPEGFHLAAAREEILSTDPFAARYTYTAGSGSITLTVNEELSVQEVTREDRATDE